MHPECHLRVARVALGSLYARAEEDGLATSLAVHTPVDEQYDGEWDVEGTDYGE